MTTQIQRRRGTTAQHSTFTGAVGEVTVDTDKEVLVVHDGAQVGGYPQMRENGSNSALALGSAGTPSLKFAGDTNTGIYSPGADQLALSTNGTGRLFVDASGNVGVGASPTAYGALTVFSSGIGGHINSTSGSAGVNFYENGTGRFSLRTLNGSAGLSFYDTFNSTERLRITSAGLVGVGTSTPWTSAAINGSGTAGDITSARQLSVGFSASHNTSFGYYQTGAGQVYAGVIQALDSGSGTRLLLNPSGGNVALGTSNANARLHISQGADSSIITYIQGASNAIRFGTTASAAQIDGVDATNGITSYQPLFLNGSDLRLGSGGTERMRLDSSGRLGIGTSSPDGSLDVRNTATTTYLGSSISQSNVGTMTLNNSGVSGQHATYYFRASSNNGTHNAEAGISCIQESNGSHATAIAFQSRDGGGTRSERLRIDSSGRVGIGTTSASANLHVSASSGTAIKITETNNGVTGALQATSGGPALGSDTNHPLTFYTNAVERFRCDASGRLLVGTASAQSGTRSQYSKFTVQGNNQSTSDGAQVNLASNTNAPSLNTGDTLGQVIFTDNGPGEYGKIACQMDGAGAGTNDYPGRLVFSTTADGASSPTERMRISQNGFTSISHPSLENVLEAKNTNASFASACLVPVTTRAAGTSCLYIYGAANGVNTFNVFNNGNVTNTNNSYGAISDIKLKQNIVDANSQWNDLKALRVRNYNFKEGQTHTQIGLVAQEVELVSPGLVTESPDRDAEGNDLGTVTKSVNYSVLYMKAVKALQEAMERIETLEAKVAALESA